MSGLILDTPTSGPCTKTEAFNEALIPEATNTYQPLPNHILVGMIHRIAKRQGIELTNQALGMDLKGQRFFGVCDIEGEEFFDGSIKMMIGFCNSYNGTMTARFCIGGKVFVCSNLAFHAYTDKRTGISGMAIRPHKNLDKVGIRRGLAIQITEAFGQIDNFRHVQESFYQKLIYTNLHNNRAYGIIVRAAQQSVINKTKVLTIANEWVRQGTEPKDIETCGYEWHEEFRFRNAYSLFNAFTQVEKDRLATNPVQSNMGTMELTEFFRREFGLG